MLTEGQQRTPWQLGHARRASARLSLTTFSWMASGKQTTNYQALGVKERSGSVDEESHSAQELSVIHTADEPDSSGTGMPIELRIGGMMCNHCRSKVEGALAQVPGVESASVDLEKELATVTGTASAVPTVSARLLATCTSHLHMRATTLEPPAQCTTAQHAHSMLTAVPCPHT